MNRVLVALLVLLGHTLCAQTDYAEPPKPVKPTSALLPAVRWSVGLDLLGPASGIWSHNFGQDVVRYGLVAHHWARKNDAWRMGYSFTRTLWNGSYQSDVVDSIREIGSDDYQDRVHAIRFGVVSMKRDRRFSPVVGLSIVLAMNEFIRSRSVYAQRLDSLSEGELYFSDILDYEGVSEGYRHDLWGEVGLEGALGYSARITEHLELEARISLWARWRAQLDSRGDDPRPDLGPAAAPFRVGLVYPAFFVHYAW